MNKEREDRNIKRINELYDELNYCYTNTGCDHEKATAILNSIIERKQFLKTKHEVSSYVDFKRMIRHYVQSMKQKEFDYDEINNEQIEKKIKTFSVDQALHLYEMYKKELLFAGYPEKANDLKLGIDTIKLKVFAKQKGVIPFLKWLSLACSYRNRYLIYMLIASFVFLCITLIQNPSFAVIRFQRVEVSNNIFLDHLGNVLIYVMGLDENVKVTPITFFGVIMMFIGKSFFILFIVNYLLKKIFNKILG